MNLFKKIDFDNSNILIIATNENILNSSGDVKAVFFKYGFDILDIEFLDNQNKILDNFNNYKKAYKYFYKLDFYYFNKNNEIKKRFNLLKLSRKLDKVFAIKCFLNNTQYFNSKAYSNHQNIELITDKNNNLLLKKNFFYNVEKRVSKEVKARKILNFPEVVKIFDYDENSISMQYIKSNFQFRNSLFSFYPVKKAREIMQLMQKINALGYSVVDWNIDNFTFDTEDNLKIFDLEFLTKTFMSENFEESADFIGAKKFGYEGPCRHNCGYNDFWYPIIGLDYNSLMNDSKMTIFFKRLKFLFTKKLRLHLKKSIQKIINAYIYITWRPKNIGDFIIL